MITADAARTGNPSVVDLEDWDAASAAREVRFLWPSGEPLSASDESGLGDHVILLPTGDPALRLMFMNLGGLDNSARRTPSQGIGVARLVSPWCPGPQVRCRTENAEAPGSQGLRSAQRSDKKSGDGFTPAPRKTSAA